MKISVITVCYNSEKTIERTIKSVLSQSYKNIEYIIKDGNSKDGTMGIVNNYGKRIAKKISSKDKGLYDAMNIGVKMARGEYVCFLNSDDYFHDNNVVEEIAKAAKESNADILFGDVEFFYPEENKRVRISRQFSISELKKGNMPPHQGTFVKRSLLKKFPFDISYCSSADFDFFCRAAKSGASAKKINRVISVVSSGGISAGGVSYRETESVVKKHFGLIPFVLILIKHKIFSFAKRILLILGIKYHKG
jgi:glycosyltransferase involved in cell wall biosynthesis